MTRQRKWQIKQAESGCCIICGKKALTSSYCLEHAISDRERMRRVTGAVRRNNSLSYRLEKGIA